MNIEQIIIDNSICNILYPPSSLQIFKTIPHFKSSYNVIYNAPVNEMVDICNIFISLNISIVLISEFLSTAILIKNGKLKNIIVTNINKYLDNNYIDAETCKLIKMMNNI